jgi:prevent-host-death family protein
MELTITEAKACLTDLVRRAEDGEDVVLIRHGHAVARLVATNCKPSAENRGKLVAALRARAMTKATVGPSAARSQDFLYEG